MNGKQLGILILACAVGLVVIYYLPLVFGPTVFGQDLTGSLNFMALISKLGWRIILGTFVMVIILSAIFKTQGKSIKKIWVIGGVIIGVVILMMIFSLLMGGSALYKGAFD